MNSPLEFSYDLLAMTSAIGAIAIFFGIKLSQNASDDQMFAWGNSKSKFAFSLLMNGIFFLLGSLSVIVAKLIY